MKILFLLLIVAMLFILITAVAGESDSQETDEMGPAQQVLPAAEEAAKSLADAWQEIITTPIAMDVETFEKRIREDAGFDFSEEWIAHVKNVLRDPNTSQEIKNAILAEALPPEIEEAIDQYRKALGELLMLVPYGSVQAVENLLGSERATELLKYELRLRVLPALKAAKESFQKSH